MGAVSFSIDLDLVDALKKALPLDIFIETGTFEGDTIELVKSFFPEIYTIELSPEYFKKAHDRFIGQAHIKLIEGNSAVVLPELAPKLSGKSVLFFLDAHWCVADNTAGAQSQCPLLDEIVAINYLGDTSVVLIDDARLFLSTPPEPHDVTQWPSFDQIDTTLRGLSNQHELIVINDVIVFYPKEIQGSITNYARKYGIDWLRARQSLNENNDLRAALEEKEAVIHLLNIAVENTESQHRLLVKNLEEKEAVIHSLHKAVQNLEDQHRWLVKSIEEKEAVIHSLNIAVETDESRHRLLVKSLEENDALRKAVESPEIHRLLVKDLEEKETVIQELSKAVAAYRSAFSIIGYVTRPMNRLVSAARITKLWSYNIITPKLGNLNQHEPRALRLPSHYAQPVNLTQPPKISIITPSFNQAGFIERTLKSVLDQSYPNLEYYVQDGGSEDGTSEILLRYADRLAGWESHPDGGQSHAINLGFAKTTGEIMAWLNSDDILLPGALIYVAEYFNQHPETDVIYGHRILIDENDQEIGRWVMPSHDNQVLSWADFVPQETLFWRRRIWDKVGGAIDENFKFAMDWNLILRFRDAGARFVRLPRFLGGFRIHPYQKTSAVISEVGFQEMDRIRERALGRVPSCTEIHKAVLPYLLKHTLTDLNWRFRNKLGILS